MNGTANLHGAAPDHVSAVETKPLDLWGILRRRSGLLLGATAAGIVLAVLYLMQATTRYESNVQILVIPKEGRLPAQNNDAQLGMNANITDELLATHMQIISSPEIIGDAIEKHDLLSLESLQKQTKKYKRFSTEAAAKRYIRDNMTVNRGGEGTAKRAQVLRVTFNHSSPDDAAKILRAIVESYEQFLQQTIAGAGNEAVELIAKANQELETEVQRRDQEYRDFRQAAPLLWRKDGQSLNPHELRIKELHTELAKVRLRQAEVRSRLAVIESVESAASQEADGSHLDVRRLSIIDQSDIERLTLLQQLEMGNALSEEFQASQPLREQSATAEFKQLLDLKLQAEQERKLGESHPKLQTTLKQIEALEQFLVQRTVQRPNPKKDPAQIVDRLALAYKRLLKNDLDDLAQRERDILTLAEAEQQEAKTLIAYELQEKSMQLALDRAQKLHTAVIERLGEINLAKNYGGYLMQVIAPVEAGVRVWPIRTFVLALGLLLGACTGAGLAVRAELKDASFRGPLDVERELGLPVLTQIPPGRRFGSMGREEMPAALSKLVFQGEQREAVRSLRAVLLAQASGHDQVLQVAGPHRQDDAAQLATNLAISMAQAAKKVLLVDCDLHQPVVGNYFSVSGEHGLSNLLDGSELFDEAISMTAVNNLFVLPAGPAVHNAAELLASPAFEQILKMARQDFDFVVLLGSPVLASSDAATIAPVVDHIILNLRLDSEARGRAVQALARLAASEQKLLGVVVDASSDRTAATGYDFHEPYVSVRTAATTHRSPQEPVHSNELFDVSVS